MFPKKNPVKISQVFFRVQTLSNLIVEESDAD